MKTYLSLLTLVASTILSFNAAATVHYVDLNCTNPVLPYTSWATAATNIQDAVLFAGSGNIVLVTNGIYQNGSWPASDLTTNRLLVYNGVTVRSVNGPAFTTIQGFKPGTLNSPSAIRCVYLENGATLSGFTLTNGATRFMGSGGGVYCQSGSAVITNCIITGNWSSSGGAGVYSGTLVNCVIIGNLSYQGAGAGASSSTLVNCFLIGNSATDVSCGYGGGVYNCVLTNCVLSGNYGQYGGGGAANSTLVNCTVVSNSTSASNTYGGGTANCQLKNCIVCYNSPANDGGSSSTFISCCTFPTPVPGANNITNEPAFVNLVNGNLRLQTNSPCINSGNNAAVTAGSDLDGRPRIINGVVDIGAYEFQGTGMGEFVGWLQQYGLPTDGSADYADSDGDGLNNWQEWKTGTNPTNALSALKMTSAAPTNNPAGLVVTWQSVSGITYFLQSSSNLGAQPVFSTIQSNIVGQAGTTSYLDTSATNSGPYFYRVGVQY